MVKYSLESHFTCISIRVHVLNVVTIFWEEWQSTRDIKWKTSSKLTFLTHNKTSISIFISTCIGGAYGFRILQQHRKRLIFMKCIEHLDTFDDKNFFKTWNWVCTCIQYNVIRHFIRFLKNHVMLSPINANPFLNSRNDNKSSYQGLSIYLNKYSWCQYNIARRWGPSKEGIMYKLMLKDLI